MNKESLLPLSGFRDITDPAKDRVTSVLREVFQSFGYQFLETPALERQEILLGKMGDEAQKLLYLFEDNGERKVGLRYDLTVPLSRFVAGNYNQLALPYKRYEIGSSWRAERPQKGRFRQFTQADIDIVGAGTGAEKELLEVIKMAMERLGLNCTVLLNDRALVQALLDELKVEADLRPKLLGLLDKQDKISPEDLQQGLLELGLSDVQRNQIKSIFLAEDATLDEATKLVGVDVSGTLSSLLEFATEIGLKARYAPNMVRGLDYYTGFIVECVSDDFPSSIVGGGRYDGLVESLIGVKLPAVGISFGVDRLMDLLAISGKAPELPLFVVNLPETERVVREWLTQLRQKNQPVELFPDSNVELGKQIKFAAKRGYANIIIPLADEWKQGKVAIKNLETGVQSLKERDGF